MGACLASSAPLISINTPAQLIAETILLNAAARPETIMSYSTIMVQLDLDQPNEARLQVAAELAARFDSRLIGIAAGDIQPLYFAEGVAAEEFLEKDRDAIKSKIAKIEQEFRRRFKGHPEPVEWRGALFRPTDFVAQEVRAADLIVAGMHRGSIDRLRQADAGELVLRAGRPLLAVPPQVSQIRLKTVVVAWKDTREARRAVNDALPLLHKAESVVVVELVETKSERATAKARVDDVAAWLVRRGIPTASIATKDLIGVPNQLDIVAQDEGADVIVAGAYGHTRFTEWVFGGVTHELLKLSKRCVFLSH
jgi:nucleotide-binding universal stress UspA family protein